MAPKLKPARRTQSERRPNPMPRSTVRLPPRPYRLTTEKENHGNVLVDVPYLVDANGRVLARLYDGTVKANDVAQAIILGVGGFGPEDLPAWVREQHPATMVRQALEISENIEVDASFGVAKHESAKGLSKLLRKIRDRLEETGNAYYGG